jgi:hypothetical protein
MHLSVRHPLYAASCQRQWFEHICSSNPSAKVWRVLRSGLLALTYFPKIVIFYWSCFVILSCMQVKLRLFSVKFKFIFFYNLEHEYQRRQAVMFMISVNKVRYDLFWDVIFDSNFDISFSYESLKSSFYKSMTEKPHVRVLWIIHIKVLLRSE